MNYILRRRGLGRTSCREIAGKATQPFTVVRSDRLTDEVFAEQPQYLIRWGCTSNIPTAARGAIILNTAEAIHRVNDKAGFRMMCMHHPGDLLVPPTRVQLGGPMPTADRPQVVRPAHHAQGRNFFKCSNPAELEAAWNRIGGEGYISEFIDKEAEYRIFVVQGKVAAVARKFPPENGDDTWNVARGGRFENVRWGQWPMQAIRTALNAFQLTGLDFGGVDVMTKDNGQRAWVLEINSAPSLTSEYRQTCMAKAFDWMVSHPYEPYNQREVNVNAQVWQDIIHPGVNNG